MVDNRINVTRRRKADRPITTTWERFLNDLGCKNLFDFIIGAALTAVAVFGFWLWLIVICACAQPPFEGR